MTKREAQRIANELHRDWVKEWGEGGRFTAQQIECPHCGTKDWYALPEDSYGCAQTCSKCHNYICE